MRGSALGLTGLMLFGCSMLFGCHARGSVHELKAKGDDALFSSIEALTEGHLVRPSSDDAAPTHEVASEPLTGYARVVVGVKATREREVLVILTDAARGRMLPLFVGGAEGYAIERRLEKKQTEQPLTHDLLDAAIRELGGHVVRSQIDDVRDERYRGHIVVAVGGRTLALDARASDAIVVAVGHNVPLFVANTLLAQEETSGEAPTPTPTRSSNEPLPL